MIRDWGEARWRHPYHIFALLLFVAIGSESVVAKESVELARGWEQTKEFLFNDAVASFFSVSSRGDVRERDFGLAVAKLNQQPQSDANTRESLDAFKRLVRDNPDDRIGILSRYFVGRILQLHLPDIAGALRIYYGLLSSRTGEPLAELSAAHIVALEVYGAGRDAMQKMAALERLADDLRTASGRRGYHYAMGFSYLNTSGRDDPVPLRKGIEHLLLAEKEGMPRWQDEANLVLAIAEVSRCLGDREMACKYYRRFAEEFKRDSRNFYARQMQAGLETP